jgi:hypothetical protein
LTGFYGKVGLVKQFVNILKRLSPFNKNPTEKQTLIIGDVSTELVVNEYERSQKERARNNSILKVYTTFPVLHTPINIKLKYIQNLY